MLKYIAFLLLASLPASADEVKMLKLIDFITSNSKYEYIDQDLPTVAIKTTEQMCNEIYITRKPDPCFVAGYFDHENNSIFIADKAPDTMVDEGFYDTVLLHELVHFLQHVNGEYKK